MGIWSERITLILLQDNGGGEDIHATKVRFPCCIDIRQRCSNHLWCWIVRWNSTTLLGFILMAVENFRKFESVTSKINQIIRFEYLDYKKRIEYQDPSRTWSLKFFEFELPKGSNLFAPLDYSLIPFAQSEFTSMANKKLLPWEYLWFNRFLSFF